MSEKDFRFGPTTPVSHAGSHLPTGVDPVQTATNAQPGLATAAQVTTLEALDAEAAAPMAHRQFGGGTVLGQTVSRLLATSSRTLGDGVLALSPMALRKGQVITSLRFCTGAGAITESTHWWFALYAPDLALLAQTADQVGADWDAQTIKTLALAAPVTIPADGIYWVGILLAGTSGTVKGAGENSPLMTDSGHGDFNTGLEGVAPDPAVVSTLRPQVAWCEAV